MVKNVTSSSLGKVIERNNISNNNVKISNNFSSKKTNNQINSVDVIEEFDIEDLPEDVKILYKGRFVDKKKIDEAKEKSETIKQTLKEILSEDVTSRVDVDEVLSEYDIENLLVNYLDENNSDEIPDEVIATLVEQYFRIIVGLSQQRGSSLPKNQEIVEMSDEEARELDKKSQQ